MDPKKVVLIGGLLIGCAALCFGFLGFIDVEGLYVPLAILDRTIQGIGAGMVNTGGRVPSPSGVLVLLPHGLNLLLPAVFRHRRDCKGL